MGPEIGRHEAITIYAVLSAIMYLQSVLRITGIMDSPAVATDTGAPMALTSVSFQADGCAAKATSAFKVRAGSTKRKEYRPPKQYPVTAMVETFRLLLR